jgi:hypothetical protein
MSQAHPYVDEAISWMYKTTPGLADGILSLSDLSTGTAVKTNSAPWTTGFDLSSPPNGVSPNISDPDIFPGSVLHTSLDHFNNTGFIF